MIIIYDEKELARGVPQTSKSTPSVKLVVLIFTISFTELANISPAEPYHYFLLFLYFIG